MGDRLYVLGGCDGAAGPPTTSNFPLAIKSINFASGTPVIETNPGATRVGRRLGVVVLAGNAVYAFGGESPTAGGPTLAGERVGVVVADKLTVASTDVGGTAQVRSGAAGVLCGGRVYIAGGYTSPGGLPTDSVESAALGPDGGLGPFDVEPQHLPAGRGLHTMVCVDDDELVVFGGMEVSNGNQQAVSLQVLHASLSSGVLGQFSTGTHPLTQAQVMAGSAYDALRHRIYGVAGFDNSLPPGPNNGPGVLPVVTHTDDVGGPGLWSAETSHLMRSRGGHVAAIVGTHLLVLGGYAPPAGGGPLVTTDVVEVAPLP